MYWSMDRFHDTIAGGGIELAYWLELHSLLTATSSPYYSHGTQVLSIFLGGGGDGGDGRGCPSTDASSASWYY